MSNENGNKPAAPFTHKPEYQFQECGLTKREHFAGLMMQAWIQHHGSSNNYGFNPKEAAAYAVRDADLLLAELEKQS